MSSARIRLGEASDASAIAALVNDAFGPERFFIETDRTNPEKVGVLLEKGRFLLLFENEKLAGCVYAELRGERGYFGLLAVDPKLQRTGLGGQLIAAAEDYCRAAGCRDMDLTFVNVREELPGITSDLDTLRTEHYHFRPTRNRTGLFISSGCRSLCKLAPRLAKSQRLRHAPYTSENRSN